MATRNRVNAAARRRPRAPTHRLLDSRPHARDQQVEGMAINRRQAQQVRQPAGTMQTRPPPNPRYRRRRSYARRNKEPAAVSSQSSRKNGAVVITAQNVYVPGRSKNPPAANGNGERWLQQKTTPVRPVLPRWRIARRIEVLKKGWQVRVALAGVSNGENTRNRTAAFNYKPTE